MRARMALAYSGEKVQLREVVLKDKPQAMLDVSPKGTVPVLVLNYTSDNQKVIEESLDVMLWALEQNDPEQWLPSNESQRNEQLTLVDHNDNEFKGWLDRYKYADRYPEHSADCYRAKGEEFLQILEEKLTTSAYLFGDKASFADIAIFPFVRQFAHVDKTWFDQTNYPKLQAWLEHFLQSELFLAIMPKFKQWQSEDDIVWL